jgi:hypothetical protein
VFGRRRRDLLAAGKARADAGACRHVCRPRPLSQIEHKVDQLAACLQAVTGVHVYYAAPGGMKLHASNGCTLLSHTKSVATLTVSPDVHAFRLRAQVVCARCGHEAAE